MSSSRRYEPVGEHHQGVVGGEPAGHLPMVAHPRAQGRTDRQRQQFTGAVPGEQHRRQVPGTRDRRRAAGGIDADEQAGGRTPGAVLGYRRVRPPQHPVRRQARGGHRARHRAVRVQADRRVRPVAHHVAPDQQGREVQPHGPEPVPAHQSAAPGRQMAGGEDGIRMRPARFGEQRPLEVQDRAADAVVPSGVAEVHGRETRRAVRARRADRLDGVPQGVGRHRLARRVLTAPARRRTSSAATAWLHPRTGAVRPHARPSGGRSFTSAAAPSVPRRAAPAKAG